MYFRKENKYGILTIEDVPSYLRFVKENSVQVFSSREDCEQYLIKDVFCKDEFLSNVKETAETNKISFTLAYSIITNHLIDILYEIDKAQQRPRAQTNIIIFRYLLIQIGFAKAFKKKQLYFKNIINKLIEKHGK